MEEKDLFNIVPPKKRKITNFSQCVICQKITKEECLRKGKSTSIEKLIQASNLRKDGVFDRLTSELEDLKHRDVFWHNSCYASYTSTHNLQSRIYPDACREEPSNRRAKRLSFDWSKCIFCRNASHKKDFKLINICTFEACHNIQSAAETRDDKDLLRLIQGVDLIAIEGKYHKSCHASYVSKSNINSKCASDNPATAYDQAFSDVLEIIQPDILAGKAYTMNCLLDLYKDQLDKHGTDANSYTKQKLKSRLQSYFKDSITFYQPHGSKKPEIVFSSSISLVDVINCAARMNESKDEEIIPSDDNIEEREIYNAAVTIKKAVSKCEGINISPLSVDDLNLQKARALIPDPLYWLLRYMISSDKYLPNNNNSSCSNIANERKVLMIGQDIVHAMTNARVKLPKHVGLGITTNFVF